MKRLALCIGFFFSLGIFGNSISEDIAKENLYRKASLFIDQYNTIEFNNILSAEIDKKFIPIEDPIPNIGYSNAVCWYKVDLLQDHTDVKKYILLIKNHSIDDITVYKLDEENHIEFIRSGDKFPQKQREIPFREFAYPITLKKDKLIRIYIRIQSEASINIPVFIYEPDFFYYESRMQDTFYGLYYGAILSLIFYNLFLFLGTKDPNYFLYVSYILCLLLLQTTGVGHSYEFLWPNSPIWNGKAFSFFIGLTIFFASLFTKNFLKSSIYSSNLNRILMLIIPFSLIGPILSLFSPSILIANYYSIILGLITSIIITSLAIKVWLRGFLPARLFLLAWFIFLIGAALNALKNLGLFPANAFSEHGTHIGALLKTIFLSFALANRINEIKKENQEITLKTLKLQELSKRELEEKVKERTRELNKYVGEIKRDLQMAQKIQSNLLPSQVTHLNSFIITSKYLPQDNVGGDFFDVFSFHDKKIRIFIADATGHGMQAALITMTIKSEYDSLKDILLDPAELTETLHERFFKIYQGMNLFFTSVVVDIDLDKQELSYSSAGHPTQYMIHNKSIIDLPRTSYIMGLSKGQIMSANTLPFCKGDKLILFTDGLYEEFNTSHEQYGQERLRNRLFHYSEESIENIVDRIISDLFGYMENSPTQDDITIIGVQSK